MLDQMCDANPGLLARVEWHTYSSSPLYNSEAVAKWHMYPPPDQGQYATPWLWIDGKNNGYNYPSWENPIYSEMSETTTVSLIHVGTTYDSTARTGQLKVEIHNADTIPIVDAALQFAITEDSIHYRGSNGDSIHNCVLRDYVPDQHGTPVTLAAGATDTVIVPFTIQSSWVDSRANLVVYLQQMTVQPDSSMPVYQGMTDSLLSYKFKAGVNESKLVQPRYLRVSVSPNPCRTRCEFTLSIAAAQHARISVYTPDGRMVSSQEVHASRASWSSAGLSRGIYLYRVNAGAATAEGKLVVAD